VVDLNLEVDVNLDFAKSKSKFMILLDHVIYFCISLIVLLLYYNTQKARCGSMLSTLQW